MESHILSGSVFSSGLVAGQQHTSIRGTPVHFMASASGKGTRMLVL